MVAGSTPPWCEYEVHINVQKDSHRSRWKKLISSLILSFRKLILLLQPQHISYRLHRKCIRKTSRFPFVANAIYVITWIEIGNGISLRIYTLNAIYVITWIEIYDFCSGYTEICNAIYVITWIEILCARAESIYSAMQSTWLYGLKCIVTQKIKMWI